jgi:hypothetical protein
VRLRGRPFADVVTDMVDGVVAANRVPQTDAPRVRASLHAALRSDDAIEPAARAA